MNPESFEEPEVDNAYASALKAEREGLDPGLSNTLRLVNQELDRLQQDGSGKGNVQTVGPVPYFDVTKGRPVKLQVKVLVPVKEHPKFNFVGKLLGPKGHSLKRLQEETMTKMAILGRGSMRDKAKEEDLRKLNDVKFAHLNEDLHVEISTFAPPSDAYSRLSHALEEIKRFLVPDYNDDIRQDQLRELAYINGDGSLALPPPPPPPPLPPPLLARRPGPPMGPAARAAAAAAARASLLTTPTARVGAPRSGLVAMARHRVPPGGQHPARALQAFRSTGGVARAQPRAPPPTADDGYGYEESYEDYGEEYGDGDYEYGAETADTYQDEYLEEYSAADWRLSEGSRQPLKTAALHATARGSFRSHPYATDGQAGMSLLGSNLSQSRY